MPIRALVVDDHPLLADGLRTVLDGIGSATLTAFSLGAARALLAESRFDVVLLDLSFRGSGENGFSLLDEIVLSELRVPVVILSAFDDPLVQAEARRRGAAGFLSKAATAQQVVEAVETVIHGTQWFRDPYDQSALTPRQLSVICSIASGNSEKEVAKSLHIALRTVEFHLRNARQALSARTTAELISSCTRMGTWFIKP